MKYIEFEDHNLKPVLSARRILENLRSGEALIIEYMCASRVVLSLHHIGFQLIKGRLGTNRLRSLAKRIDRNKKKSLFLYLEILVTVNY